MPRVFPRLSPRVANNFFELFIVVLEYWEQQRPLNLLLSAHRAEQRAVRRDPDFQYVFFLQRLSGKADVIDFRIGLTSHFTS